MDRWLLTWLLAPLLFPGGMAVEAFSLYWYVLESERFVESAGSHRQEFTAAR
jgi:hypothetical protein